MFRAKGRAARSPADPAWQDRISRSVRLSYSEPSLTKGLQLILQVTLLGLCPRSYPTVGWLDRERHLRCRGMCYLLLAREQASAVVYQREHL